MHDIGWSGFIGVGNQSDIPLYDHVAYLGDDPNTGVIALYIEGLPEGQGQAFKEICQAVSRKKPIVALKGGRTTAGRRAAQSHTASLSSEAQTYSALFDESGIVEVGHLEHLLPIAEVLYRCPPLKGDRIAIVGSGGGHPPCHPLPRAPTPRRSFVEFCGDFDRQIATVNLRWSSWPPAAGEA